MPPKFVCVSPAANPKTRIHVQVIYLRGTPANAGQGVESETGKAREGCMIGRLPLCNRISNLPESSGHGAEHGSELTHLRGEGAAVFTPQQQSVLGGGPPPGH